jgi:hypothetical protein
VAIAFVRKTDYSAAAASASIPITLSSPSGAGNFLAALVVCANGDTPTVTDDASNSWGLALANGFGSGSAAFIVYTTASPASASTVTVTFAGGGDVAVRIVEFSGVYFGAGDPLDQVGVGFGTDASPHSNPTSANNSGDLAVGLIGWLGSATASGHPGGWTAQSPDLTGGTVRLDSGYQLSANTLAAFSASLSASSDWAVGVATFYGSAPAAPPVGNPLPPFKVQVGFASNPLDNPQIWTDITVYVKDIRIARGRQHVLSHFEPGRLELTCLGYDRALDPFNTASSLYPNIKVNKQIQVLASTDGGITFTPLFTGFVDAWTPLWPDNLYSDVKITATDGLRFLQADGLYGLAAVVSNPVVPPFGGGGGPCCGGEVLMAEFSTDEGFTSDANSSISTSDLVTVLSVPLNVNTPNTRIRVAARFWAKGADEDLIVSVQGPVDVRSVPLSITSGSWAHGSIEAPPMSVASVGAYTIRLILGGSGVTISFGYQVLVWLVTTG